MRNPKFASTTDEDLVEAYQWIKQQATVAILEGRETEQYRVPLKELGDEVNVRINETLDEIEEVLNS